MQTQNLKNHSRFVPLYHYVTFGLLLAILIGSIVNVCLTSCENCYTAWLIVAIAFALILIALFARSFALKAQDRTIRAEENFRYFIITGKSLPIELSMSQIIALRFAGNDEWIDLIKKAISENLTSKQIKENIKSWKGDYNRV